MKNGTEQDTLVVGADVLIGPFRWCTGRRGTLRTASPTVCSQEGAKKKPANKSTQTLAPQRLGASVEKEDLNETNCLLRIV